MQCKERKLSLDPRWVKLVGIVLVGVVAVSLTTDIEAQPRDGVTIYAGGDFTGASETFYGDVPDMSRTRIGNDHASSVRVAPGCTVILYAGGNYQGRSTSLNRDLRSLKGSEVGNDALSSLRLRCGRSPGVNPGYGDRRGVTLYRDTAFTGRKEIFYEDDSDLRNNRVGSAASSVRVAPGCSATLYSEPGYRGQSVEIGSDVGNLRRTRLGNYSAASIRVRCSGDPWRDRRDDRWDGPGGSGSGGGWNPWGNDRRDRRPRGAATLYAGGNFSGRSETFYGDVERLAETSVGNDTVSSVQVERGCRLELFEHPGYGGNSAVLTGDVPDMRRTILGNDRASSMRLDCDRGGYGGGYGDYGRGGVTLYAGGDYSGRSETFYGDVDRLAETSVGNDTVSSVRISPGCEVELFEHPGYGGHATVLSDDVPDMRRTSLGNDRASSLRLYCRRSGRFDDRGVTVYRGGDFTGGSETFYHDVSNLGRTAVGNDEASSVRVPPGCRAILYRHSDFRGESTVLTRDAPNLRLTEVGNDALSSIEVDCR